MKNLLITGGAGFIGSHTVGYFLEEHPGTLVVNADKLNYAANLENLSEIEGHPDYCFEKGDLCDRDFVERIFDAYGFDTVIHLAAESHVDRSIQDAVPFVKANVEATVTLMDVAWQRWKTDPEGKCFIHVSTDEVYGSLGDEGLFTESSPYDPRSPYSASKAASDHFVRAYYNTYGFPAIVTNCSNNYGPRQFPEKLLPLMINNLVEGAPLPVYGKGEQVRDWIWVGDHVRALDKVRQKGEPGATYLIGSRNEWKNLDLIRKLCALMDERMGWRSGTAAESITFVKDREGHDQRYAIDPDKIERELGWLPELSFEEGLKRTIDWYLKNREWLANVTSGAYLAYYEKQYGPL